MLNAFVLLMILIHLEGNLMLVFLLLLLFNPSHKSLQLQAPKVRHSNESRVLHETSSPEAGTDMKVFLCRSKASTQGSTSTHPFFFFFYSTSFTFFNYITKLNVLYNFVDLQHRMGVNSGCVVAVQSHNCKLILTFVFIFFPQDYFIVLDSLIILLILIDLSESLLMTKHESIKKKTQ